MTSALSYAVLQNESAWGTVAGGIVDRYQPLTSFALKAEVETRQAKTNCGIKQPRFAEKIRRSVRGQITAPLYGAFAPDPSSPGTFVADSYAEHLLQWAFASPETADRASKSLHWFDTVSGSRWSGLRVDEATLAGDENGITLSLSLVGKIELASGLTPTLPDNRSKLLEFQFSDVAIVFDSAALPIESFEWTISHGLKLKHNGYTPSSCKATGGTQTLTVKPLKTSAAFTVLQRLQAMPIKTASITMSCNHSGTGASGDATQLVIAFNRLAIIDASDDVSVEDYDFQPLRMSCLKPNSATVAVGQTWSLI